MGQERRAAVLRSAEAALAAEEEAERLGGTAGAGPGSRGWEGGSVKVDFNPSLQASDCLEKSQDVFMQEEASKKALLLTAVCEGGWAVGEKTA